MLQAHVAEKRDGHTIGVMDKFLFSLHQSPSLEGLLTVRVTEQYLNSNVGKCAVRQFSEPLEVLTHL